MTTTASLSINSEDTWFQISVGSSIMSLEKQRLYHSFLSFSPAEFLESELIVKQLSLSVYALVNQSSSTVHIHSLWAAQIGLDREQGHEVW